MRESHEHDTTNRPAAGIRHCLHQRRGRLPQLLRGQGFRRRLDIHDRQECRRGTGAGPARGRHVRAPTRDRPDPALAATAVGGPRGRRRLRRRGRLPALLRGPGPRVLDGCRLPAQDPASMGGPPRAASAGRAARRHPRCRHRAPRGRADRAGRRRDDDLRPGPADGAGGNPVWAAEVVVAKRLLADLSSWTVGLTRMGVGSVVLVAWTLIRGQGGALTALTGEQWMWVLLTGVILAGYVSTWFAALSRAPAVDVTAVLVVGAVITALLAAGVKGAPLVPQLGWVALVLMGAILVAVPGWRGRDTLASAR